MGWGTMIKIGYAICTNCGCNKATVEVYRCQDCKKMYCKKCLEDVANCSNPECGTTNLEHKGYIQPFDEVLWSNTMSIQCCLQSTYLE